MRSLSVVVLPAPFGPRKPKISFDWTVSVRSSRARDFVFLKKPVSKSFVSPVI